MKIQMIIFLTMKLAVSSAIFALDVQLREVAGGNGSTEGPEEPPGSP